MLLPLLAVFGYQVNQSLEMDEKSIRKNSKAFTKMAEAQNKLEYYNETAVQKLAVLAKRKHGLLTCHIKMFQEQYLMIKRVEFKKGKGIEEFEKLEEMQEQICQYMALPAVVSGETMTDSSLMLSFALSGIGGYMMKDSKRKLKLASANQAQANAISVQIESMCIFLDGISKHVDLLIELLEKLGMLYMKSIRNITRIFDENGMDADEYSDQDIEAINLSLVLTKLIYRIINTPMINAEGKIEQESIKVIEEGNKMIQKINGGN